MFAKKSDSTIREKIYYSQKNRKYSNIRLCYNAV